MPNTRFGRKYELLIGNAVELVKKTTSGDVILADGEESTPSAASTTDFKAIPTNYMSITDLQVSGKVIDSKKSNTTNSKDTTFNVVNLSVEEQNFIKPESSVFFSAGYEGDESLPLVYNGNVISVETLQDGPNFVTTIKCKTGAVVRRNVRVSRSPILNETVEDVINYFASILAKNGIPTGNIFIPISQVMPYGFPCAGNLFYILDDFCNSNNLKHYIALGKLYVEPIDSTEFVEVIHVEEANVKGAVTAKKDIGSVANKDGAPKGITFTTYLDGTINSSTKCEIVFGDYKGNYKILTAEHTFDLEGAAWDTKVEAEEIKR